MGQWGKEVKIDVEINGKAYELRLAPHFTTDPFAPIKPEDIVDHIVILGYKQVQKV